MPAPATPVSTPLACGGGGASVRLRELADALDRGHGLGQQRREELEDVDHLVVHFERDVHARGVSALIHASRVVAQDLGVALVMLLILIFRPSGIMAGREIPWPFGAAGRGTPGA